jgi:hypothetical protein
MLSKGTLVKVRTTNGGETIAHLLQNYRPTYDAVIEIYGQCVVISPWHLLSIESVQ